MRSSDLCALGFALALAAVACGGDEVWDCELGLAGDPGGVGAGQPTCQLQWTCNQSKSRQLSLLVSCTQQGDTLKCGCFGNGAPAGSFAGSPAMCTSFGAERAAEVNAGCHWSVPEE